MKELSEGKGGVEWCDREAPFEAVYGPDSITGA